MPLLYQPVFEYTPNFKAINLSGPESTTNAAGLEIEDPLRFLGSSSTGWIETLAWPLVVMIALAPLADHYVGV